jgi:hypothetical protein
MSDFLDDKYEVPQKSGNYMRWIDGENKFRILGKPVLGWEGWKEQKDGGRKPVRKHMDEIISVDEVDEEDKIKHFWAMPVWNYQEEKVQILEITQKGIQKSIRAMEKSKDWGSPLEYDILVTKSGQKLETEYQVNPIPPKKLDPAIYVIYENMEINLEALFEGEDPFASKIDIDKVSKEIK